MTSVEEIGQLSNFALAMALYEAGLAPPDVQRLAHDTLWEPHAHIGHCWHLVERFFLNLAIPVVLRHPYGGWCSRLARCLLP